MASCPKCNKDVHDSAKYCSECGTRVIPAETLEKIPTKTSTWQKIVIAVSIIILIAIGFTFQGAEERENKAAQNIFTQPVADIVKDITAQTGLGKAFGLPAYTFSAKTKSAEVFLQFPRGPLNMEQAASFGQGVCGAIARAYVNKGYIPRHISVHVSSMRPDGTKLNYGEAIYNGNIDALGWEAVPQK